MKYHLIHRASAVVLLCILALLHPFILTGQEAAKPARPKVGLALSGGAAKGFAHIGVLKILEEAGIVPDFITGTSMGSIMGGLYAIGYPADSLAAMSISQDWDLTLSDNIPLNEVFFEEKLFFRNQLVELPFRKGKLEAPTGLIHGQQIEELLGRLTMPVYNIRDFDSLPIPFHCMAADIVSGQPVELSKGSLAEAMRASMAIPTIFTPVQKDSMVLVDGGLIRNLPAKELKDMGADIIIGVYVGAESKDAAKLRSFTRILTQIAFLTSIQDAEEQLPYIDIYIKPDLGTFGPADFKSADTIITLGEAAARAQFSQLQQLADSLNALGPPPARPQVVIPSGLLIDRIEVAGNERLNDSEVIKWSGLQPGQAVSVFDLQEAVESIYGTNYFQKITYSLRREDGENVLALSCQEKAPLLLKGSLIYDSYHEAGIAFSLTMRNLIFPSSRFMFVGRLANNYRYRFEYLKYIGPKQRWFMKLAAQFNRDQLPIIQEGRTFEEFGFQEAPIDLALQTRVGKNAMAGIGAQLELMEIKPTVSTTPVFDKLNYSNLNLAGFFRLNTFNHNILPTRGANLMLEAKYITHLSYMVENLFLEGDPDSLFAFNPYPKFTLSADSYIPLGNRSVLRLAPFASLLWNSENALSDFYFVGAPQPTSRRSIPFYGLDTNEFVAQVAIGALAGYQFFIRNNLMVAADLNAGFFAAPGAPGNGLAEPDIFLSGMGLSATYNSLVGPIKLTIMAPLNQQDLIKNKLKAFLSFGHRF